jgi:hypothetical protein
VKFNAAILGLLSFKKIKLRYDPDPPEERRLEPIGKGADVGNYARLRNIT